MGQAKIKTKSAFSNQLIDEWETDHCVNFAIALARISSWLLHVDWWAESLDMDNKVPLNQMIPLRVYVADNHDRIFDVRGVRSIREFNEGVLMKLMRSADLAKKGAVRTRFYSEEKLYALPLRSKPQEALIARAMEEICANQAYLSSVPKRVQPCLPAHKAAEYTYGRCAAFAEAMSELTGLQTAALLAKKFSPQFEATKRNESGYFHSVILHQDGIAEDAWGKAPVAEIANRFGVVEFEVSKNEHEHAVERIKQSSREIYDAAFADSISLIKTYCLGK